MSVPGQPLERSFGLVLHVLGRDGTGRERQTTHRARRHLHHRYVGRRDQIAEEIRETDRDLITDLTHVDADQTYCKNNVK